MPHTTPEWSIDVLSPSIDERAAALRVGMIVLATDLTTERDLERMLPPTGVAAYLARIAYANPTNRANLMRMQPRLEEAAALILPGEHLDAIGFSCTAASVEIGDDRVRGALQAAKPGTPAVTPLSGALKAFRALGLSRIALLTPYTPTVTESVAATLRGQGLEPVSVACFNQEDDRVMARIEPQAIMEAAVQVTTPDAEGLFISCTALRSAETVQAIESRTGKPVVTSNQAMIWELLRAAGYAAPVAGYGRLLEAH